MLQHTLMHTAGLIVAGWMAVRACFDCSCLCAITCPDTLTLPRRCTNFTRLTCMHQHAVLSKAKAVHACIRMWVAVGAMATCAAVNCKHCITPQVPVHESSRVLQYPISGKMRSCICAAVMGWWQRGVQGSGTWCSCPCNSQQRPSALPTR